MKRLPSIFLLLTIAVTVFAEEQFTSNPQIRLGGHITSQFPAGNMSPYANAAVGLGADVLFFCQFRFLFSETWDFHFMHNGCILTKHMQK